ncbi:MAG TPA: hypothetical protein ENH40_07115, partial [Nitrospirae bacterium]|nr:hypothetical protein [Nitrospirota bacterium]
MDLIDENKRIEKELKGKRLICELAFDRSDFDQWRLHLPQGFKAWNYPFVAAAMTVGIGVYEYEQGDYWHAFPWLTKPGDQSRWGNKFEIFLEKHETLETFKSLRESGHRYIAPILAHGGIPLYCLQDFFLLLTDNMDYEQSSNDFIEFLKYSPSCLQNIDKPIQRFLLHGGEVAEEFVARILALWQSREGGYGGGTYGLPKRVVDAFADWHATHGFINQQRQRIRNRPRAALRIKPGDLGVYLYLPHCNDHPEIGKNAHWKALGKSWATTSSHEIPLPLSDQWIVEIGGRIDTLAGITNSLPSMFFDRETGKVISDPKHRRLPEHLWAIYRQTSNTTPSPCYSEPLPDWPEHVIAVFDLSGYKELQIDDYVFEVRLPFFQISQDPVVRGCRAEKGLPVFFDVPRISWEGLAHLTLVKDGINQGSIDIEASNLDMWFDEPGEYLLHLRGPFGQNVRKNFVFICGLSLKTQPEIKWPTTKRVSFEVSSDYFKFLSDDGEPPPFISTDSVLIFHAVTETQKINLVAEVPGLKWRFIGVDAEAGKWTNKPIEVNVQDLQEWDYPRLIFELANVEDQVNISLLGNHGSISSPQGHRSEVSAQNIWAFDLRKVREQVIQSGRGEEFDVLVQKSNGQLPYRGKVLSVRPQWDISNFQAKWKKDDEFQEIHVSWTETGPIVADRYLVLIPLWRPWKGGIEIHQLSDNERSSFVWRLRTLRPGRYVIRAIHAPWGCADWLNAQHIIQRHVDVYKQSWEVTFCQGIDEAVSLEEYLESLLAHWYRPTLVKAPLVPKDLAASQIRKFLEGLERVNRVEEIRIPRNGSGALNLFCYNPVATMEAVSTVQYFPDIWQKVLPSLDILTFIPSAQDEAFIEEVVFQYTAPSLSSVARFIKHKFKQRSLSHPMQLWRKNLANTLPPAAE